MAEDGWARIAATAAEIDESGGNDVDLRGLTIRNYTSAGSFSSIGTIEVDAREFVNLSARSVSYYVNIEIKTSGEYGSRAACSIPYEKLDSLIVAVEQLEISTFDRDRFDFTEIHYQVEELSVVAFNDARGRAMASIASKGASVHINPLQRLSEFRMLLKKAKTTIERLKVEHW